MSFRIGDPIFNTSGRPGVIQSRDDIKAEIVADEDFKGAQKAFRNGYLKGLTPEQRQSLNEVMDEVKKIEKPEDKVRLLQEKIQELENDPTRNSQRVISYYKAELSHAVHSFNYDPRFFTIPMNRIVE